MFANRKSLPVIIGALFAIGAVSVIATSDPSVLGTARAAPAPAPAPEVDVANVVARDITEWQSYSGRLEAVDKVEIRPLVPGKIVAVHFKDGAIVSKGAPLFTIDPKPYQAEVERAAAQLSAAEARLAYAASDADRADRLIAADAIAKRDFDEKHNAGREAQANLRAAKAALDAAKVNLSYTEISAPVGGRVSRAELTVGNVVSTGANAPLLSTLVSVSPIYASFDVDEQTYLRYLRKNVGKSVPVSIGLADEAGYSRNGAVVSVDNHLNAGSATIRVRASIDNADGSLVPGLYARVKVGAGKPVAVVMVTDDVVGTDQSKSFVLVVDKQNKIQYREIEVGNLHDGMRVVTRGLVAGERIVVNGMQRAKPNETVRVRTVQMSAPAGPAQAS